MKVSKDSHFPFGKKFSRFEFKNLFGLKIWQLFNIKKNVGFKFFFGLKNLGFKSLELKNPWVKKTGLKILGLKNWVKKSLG